MLELKRKGKQEDHENKMKQFNEKCEALQKQYEKKCDSLNIPVSSISIIVQFAFKRPPKANESFFFHKINKDSFN